MYENFDMCYYQNAKFVFHQINVDDDINSYNRY